MSHTVRILLGLVIVGVIAVGGFLLYIYVRGGTGEASLSIEDAAATRAASAPTSVASVPTTVVETESIDVTENPDETAEAETGEPEASPTEAANVVSSEGVVFSIVPEESEVRFELDEDLRGVRTTVVGRTDQVAGDITVNFEAPSQSELSPIVINMRTLSTDNEFRNRAIRGEILLSARDEFEFGEFQPTTVTGLPDAVAMGEAFTFQVTGNLILRGETNEVTFDVTVTPVSETRLEGTASTIVDRTLYGMEIPSAPGVANVEEEVELYIDFVAEAA